MRPSSIVQSGMPSGHKWIGWYGNFGGPTQKYINSYAVSPFQQNPFAGVLKGYFFNGIRRTVVNLPYAGYFIYTWGNDEFAFVNSKAGHLKYGGEH